MRTATRERSAAETKRREDLFQQRTIFQRQTLLDLQDALFKLGRATGSIHHEDKMALKKAGTWQKQRLDGELDEDFRLGQMQNSILASRVRDNGVRELVEEFRMYCTRTAMAATPADADRAFSAAIEVHEPLNKRIGEILRGLEDMMNE